MDPNAFLSMLRKTMGEAMPVKDFARHILLNPAYSKCEEAQNAAIAVMFEESEEPFVTDETASRAKAAATWFTKIPGGHQQATHIGGVTVTSTWADINAKLGGLTEIQAANVLQRDFDLLATVEAMKEQYCCFSGRALRSAA